MLVLAECNVCDWGWSLELGFLKADGVDAVTESARRVVQVMSRGLEINTFGSASSCYRISAYLYSGCVPTYGDMWCNNNPYGVIISIITSLGQ